MTKNHYIKEWRKFRYVTQAALADKLGVSMGTVAKLESGQQPYTEKYLVKIAEVLKCQPVDLITRDPNEGETVWSILGQMDEGQKKTALNVLKAITGEKS